jgi:hypothetical protein
VYQRTRGRLTGLTDDEYLWSQCLWHLIGCYGAKRNSEWLGVERRSGRFCGSYPAPATAAEAIAEQIHHGAELGVLRDLYARLR